jgi:hypothetical protein
MDIKAPHKITEFLWWCAGADRQLLMKCPMEDRVKYAGIGGIVFATGILAACAGGFAFNTAFGPKSMAGDNIGATIGWTIITIAFGICWGFMIFNLDRFIVSSTGKGDGTDSITLKEFGQAIPRLIIALILGLTISKPLELEIIKTEINVELRKKQQEKQEEFDKKTYSKFKSQIEQIDSDLKKLEESRSVLFDRLKAAEQEYIDQMQGRAGMAGYGPRAKQLEQLKIEKQKELDAFDAKHASEIKALKSQRESKLNERDKELNITNRKQAENLDGLLERISIAHDIGFWLGIALTLIFLSIEMGPIFFKMMMTKGAYDFMVENNRNRKNVENGIYREDHVYEGKNGLIHMEKWRYLEVESAKNEKIKKTEAQDAINKEVIRQWEARKIDEVKSNPTKFFTEGDESLKNNNA